jgi:hypothetical protein
VDESNAQQTHTHTHTHNRTPAHTHSSLPDGPCAICDKDDCYAADLFVQCAGCALTVHQGCYGIRTFPGDADWLCDLCKNDPSPPAVATSTMCALCGKRGGALKKTVDGRLHAHLACVIWIPEAHVVETTTMGPVEIRHVPVSRQVRGGGAGGHSCTDR